MELSSVQCPVSGVSYRIIHPGNHDDLTTLKTWASDIVEQFRMGKPVTVALDCEGIFLGEQPKSGLCVQLGEIYNAGFAIRSGTNKHMALNPKPGVIVLWPMSPEVREAISTVLSSSVIQIATFDFVADIAILLEEGIRINMKNILDAQAANAPKGQGFLRNVKTPKLAKIVGELSPNEDRLVTPAVQLMSRKTKVNWDAIFFMGEHGGLNSTWFIDPTFMEYAAMDITLTGLAITWVIAQQKMKYCIMNSHRKVDEFESEIRSAHGITIMPPLIRQTAFFTAYKTGNYSDVPDVLSSPEAIAEALVTWRSSRLFLIGERAVGCKLSDIETEVHTRRSQQAITALTKVLPAVRALTLR